jgi:tripartite-type tricarboxylate transporter receptor subunit TctC
MRHPSAAAATLSRRELLALGAAFSLAPTSAWCEDYPARPIRLMVGFAPGGGVDVSARIIAPRLGEELKTTIVVDNKAGASGMICSEYVARATPDGYTLMYTGGSAVTIAPQLVAKPPINSLTDLVPVNVVGASPLVISMHPGAGIRTLAEFMAQARSRDLKLASAGIGTLTHLTIELLSQATGGRIVHVPYKGGGAALADALAGHVDGMVSDIPPVFAQFQDGRLVPVAVTSEQRVDMLPAVPTMNEVVRGFTAASWNGLFAPKGTPQAIVEKVSAALVKVVGREDIAAQLKKAGVIPGPSASAEAFRSFVAGEFNRWGKLVKERNIVAQ